MHVVSGDPVRLIAGPDAPESVVQRIRVELGLERPLHQRYASYLGRALRGDLGRSLRSRGAVVDEILAPFPATLELTTASMLIAVALGVPLGLDAGGDLHPARGHPVVPGTRRAAADSRVGEDGERRPRLPAGRAPRVRLIRVVPQGFARARVMEQAREELVAQGGADRGIQRPEGRLRLVRGTVFRGHRDQVGEGIEQRRPAHAAP
jgi:hypothetical protein